MSASVAIPSRPARLALVSLVLAALVVTATPSRSEADALRGALIGAGGGALFGAIVGGGRGAAVGAIVGGVAGTAIGAERARERRMYARRQMHRRRARGRRR